MQRTTMRVKYCCNFLISACYGFGRARSFSIHSNLCNKVRISYLTDVEGDLMYLKRFVENSKVLQFSDEAESGDRIDFIDDKGQLVYGGDICDKGGNDLKVLELLLDLKDRYNDRVHFILGNRDANKLRLLQEIGVAKDDDLPYHRGAWWLAGTGRIGDPTTEVSTVPDDARERLKWILKHTMGSPDAFEYRRAELSEISSVKIDDVSDDDVTQSYREFASPDGLLGRYLSQGCLALRLGNVLFMHGALPLDAIVCDDKSYKFPTPWNDGYVETLDEWILELNSFVKQQYFEWKISIENHSHNKPRSIWSTKGGYGSGIAGGDLIQYCMGWLPAQKLNGSSNPKETGKRNPTVVYNNWARSDLLNDVNMIEFFTKNNLQAIVTGHQPHGDSPLCVRVNEDCLIISADTSYSGDVMWLGGKNAKTCESKSKSKSFRGDIATSELLIDFFESNGFVETINTHGILNNGVTYSSTNFLDDPHVGNVACIHSKDVPSNEHKWWTKFRLDNGKYLVCHTEGYNVTNAIVDSTDLLPILQQSNSNVDKRNDVVGT